MITSTVSFPERIVSGAATEWEIRPETADDAPHVSALVAHVFGPGRFAKSAYRLREGVDPITALSFVAVENGMLRGSVRFWPVLMGQEPALLLGPLAVQSDQRGRGIGIALMERGIVESKRLGHRAIILVGDLPYYSRVGFMAVPPGRIQFPGPVDRGRILALPLAEDGLAKIEHSALRKRHAGGGASASQSRSL